MRVYEAIVKALESVGVDAAFGGAGENAAGAMIALKHSTKIRPVIVRHEQAASFMACGYAIYSGKLGVCFATAGPGGFNLFSGLAVAMSDSYPVLAITGFSRVVWKGKGALNETSGVSRTPELASHVRRHHQAFFLPRRHFEDLRRRRRGGQSRLRRPPRAGPHPRARGFDARRPIGRQLSRHQARREAAAAGPGRDRRRRRRRRAGAQSEEIGHRADRLRRGAQRRRPRIARPRRTLPNSVRHHARRQGHHR